MPITDWPEQERPREKLLERGASALSDAELLAIFLRVGVRGKSAVDLARDLLTHFGGVRALVSAQPKAFAAVHGVGLAKYAQLQAAFELARRALAETAREADLLSDPESVKDWLRLRLAGLEHEVFYALLLDNRHRLLAAHELFRGTVDQTAVHPRELVKLALHANASAVIVAHNHPSGSAAVSSADQQITTHLKQALALIDVRLLDHIIIAGTATHSMAEHGQL